MGFKDNLSNFSTNNSTRTDENERSLHEINAPRKTKSERTLYSIVLLRLLRSLDMTGNFRTAYNHTSFAHMVHFEHIGAKGERNMHHKKQTTFFRP